LQIKRLWEVKVNAHRTIAIIVGVLFIIGTAAGVLSVVFTNSTFTAPDYLVQVSANSSRVVLGALCVVAMGFALAFVPVVAYPVFKKYSETLAMGYVVFRGGIETITYIVTATSFLLLLPVSREFVAAGAPPASYIQTLGALLRALTGLPMTVFVFGLGALILYYLLYQSKLIPRWISIWGFIAILLHLATGILIVFSWAAEDSQLVSLMNLPIFFQEMVMAVWLIVKGFDPFALAALNAKTSVEAEVGK
jgi:Domain of unknown function (DUF4386)